MAKHLLLVGGKGNAARIRAKALAVGLETICLPDTSAQELLLQSARDQRVAGLLALDATAVDTANAVATALALPGIAAAWRESEAKIRYLEQVRGEGVPTTELKLVQPGEAIGDGTDGIEVPAWVEPSAVVGRPLRLRVDHRADLPLAFAKIRTAAPGIGILLHRAWNGPIFRLYGFLVQRDFVPIEITGEELLTGPFPLPIGAVCPAPLEQHDYQTMITFANKAARHLPAGCYLVEFEFVLDAGAPILIGCNPARMITSVYNDLLAEALGIDLECDCLRVAVGDMPRETPKRALAAAVRWITAHSGIVEEISGVEAAKAGPGVRKIVLSVKCGDTLRHVADTAARDGIGYVLATAALRAEAPVRAARACQLIQVVTRQIVA